MRCRACRSDRLDPVFEMAPMPLAGAFAPTQADAFAAQKYPLTWLLCHDCGLVNVEPDIPDDLIYRTYSYAASTVPAVARHHAAFARVLTERYRTPVRFLEIGCNDGVLLRQLPAAWDKWGVDPSDIARRAPNRPYTLADVPFSVDVARWLGEVDVVSSSNTFAHFTDIAGAFDGVARVLRPGGEFWIEVHDLDATLRTGQWDTIYHEHKVEWSLRALLAAGAARGMQLNHLSHLPLHGGLIRVRFVKNGNRTTIDAPLHDFADLQKRYDERRPPPLLAHSAAYGAAGRATVYLNQMWPLPIDYVVDASPVRAGRFVPGVGLPILPLLVFDTDQPETTLITAWNHAADIRAQHPGYEGWVTAW